MQIVGFTAAHIEQAGQIAKQNYENERRHVPALPHIDSVPDLSQFAENGLGVAALEDGMVTGFLCAVGPFNNAFRSTDAIGVFSPMGAHGVIGENRMRTYALMYSAAGERWVDAGASSHGICLYAHDSEAKEQFFRYGFGMRCVDAVRNMDEVDAVFIEGYECSELGSDELLELLPLEHMLDAHMKASPTFILRPSATCESFLKRTESSESLFFAAKKDREVVAYIRAERGGETFICDMPGYMHINGAFCLPEHRGKGLNQTLLRLLVHKLKCQGYTRMGVDFESINPVAYGFWLKHFSAYTHSAVRRIDEHAINR